MSGRVGSDPDRMAIHPRTDEVPLPELGTPVWLEGTRHGPLATSVLRREGDLIGLDRPRIGGEEVLLDSGARVRIAYRVHNVPCAVSAEAAERDAASELAWFVRTGPTLRFQRRNDFRVEHSLTARVWTAAEGDPDRAPLVAVTHNLSARGVLVRTVAGLRINEHVDVELDLPSGILTAPAVVVRITDPHTGNGEREVALHFDDMDPDDEQRLRADLMERQRVARRRELGDQ